MGKPKVSHVDPPDVLELFKSISDLLASAKSFEGDIVRCVGAMYARKMDFFSGVGAAKAGGRWNRPGLEAIYASLDIQTANAEAYQAFIRRGFSLSRMLPRVTAVAQVKLDRVFDLTHASNRKKIGFTLSDLIHEDWRALQKFGIESWTQAIGRGCHFAGFEALVVPSAQHKGGKNIVLFPDKVATKGKIKIVGEEQLPK